MTQLQTLKLRTGEKNEALLETLLSNAREYILAHTRRVESDWLPVFDGIQLNIAAIDYNRLGGEGFASRKEGDISTVFADYPDSVAKTLNQYRLVKVI